MCEVCKLFENKQWKIPFLHLNQLIHANVHQGIKVIHTTSRSKGSKMTNY